MEYEDLLNEAYGRRTKFFGVFGRFAGRYSDASLVGDCATKKVNVERRVLLA